MSVPAMLSNPGLALQGACFDLDDLQAMIEDYESRMAQERVQREKAEAHLAGCLTRVTELEGELAKLKNLVVGGLAKVQGAPPPPATGVATQPVPRTAPVPAAKPAATTMKLAAPPPTTKPVAATKPIAATKPAAPTPAPTTKPTAVAGQVPFSAPRASAPQHTAVAAVPRSAPVDSGEKPKRRIMRSRRG